MSNDNTVCPYCKTTKEEFVNDGLLGCERCYQAFAQVILPWLNKNQSASRHTGKRALSVLSKSQIAEYKSLIEQPDIATYAEDYAQMRRIQARLEEIRNAKQ